MNVAGKGSVQYRYPLVSLGSDKFQLGIGRRVLSSEVHDASGYPVFSANVKEPFGYIDRLLIDDFSSGSVLWGIDGDWMTSYVEPGVPLSNRPLRGTAGSGPRHWPVLHLLDVVGRGDAAWLFAILPCVCQRMEEVKIPVPPKNVQELSLIHI